MKFRSIENKSGDCLLFTFVSLIFFAHNFGYTVTFRNQKKNHRISTQQSEQMLDGSQWRFFLKKKPSFSYRRWLSSLRHKILQWLYSFKQSLLLRWPWRLKGRYIRACKWAVLGWRGHCTDKRLDSLCLGMKIVEEALVRRKSITFHLSVSWCLQTENPRSLAVINISKF